MTPRFCVVICTRDNPPALAKTVGELLRETLFPILVVDRGSDPATETVLREAGLVSDRLRILRLLDAGQGEALQEGFLDCLDRDFTHALTMNDDGRHSVGEIQKLIAVSQKNPWDLVVAHKPLEHLSADAKRRHRVKNFLITSKNDAPNLDEQSDFRIYPLAQVQTMPSMAGRFDFANEILIRLMWRGVPVQEIAVQGTESQQVPAVGFWHGLRKTLDRTVLNTVFMLLSLLHSENSTTRLSLALGVGVFIGCSPFYGFHTLLVVAFAVIFRLNAVALLIGAQISLPPMTPILILAEVGLGAKIDHGASRFMQWFVGSTIIGTVLGLVVMAVALVMMRSFRKLSQRQISERRRQSDEAL